MGQTVILAATADQDDSSEFDVVAGAVVAVSSFTASGIIGPQFAATLQRKIGSDFFDVPGSGLDSIRSEYVVRGPGTYRVTKQVSQQAVGFATDDGEA